MKKKLLIALLVGALVVTAVIGGTFAYLTASDGDINVMTVGKVNIELWEQERELEDSNNDGELTLLDFQQSKRLVPLVGNTSTLDDWGMPTAPSFVDKIVSVKNVGDTDAYVRVIIAVPAALADVDGDAATVDPALHLMLGERFDSTNSGTYNATPKDQLSWSWGEPTVQNIVIDEGGTDVDYVAYTYICSDKLEAGALSDAVITGLYLDGAVDYDDDTDTWLLGNKTINYDLSERVEIPVYAQAIQADGFTDAEAAFGNTGMTANPWGDTVMVATEAELNAAVENGANISLTDNITLTSELEIDANVTLDGNGFTLTGGLTVKPQEAVVIKNLNLNGSLTVSEYTGVITIRDCQIEGNVTINITEAAKLYMNENTYSATATKSVTCGTVDVTSEYIPQ